MHTHSHRIVTCSVFVLLTVLLITGQTFAQEWLTPVREKIQTERAILSDLNREYSRLSTDVREERRKERDLLFRYKEQELELAELESQVKRIELERARVQEDIKLGTDKPDLVGRAKLAELLEQNRILNTRLQDAISRRDEKHLTVERTRQLLETQTRSVEQLEDEQQQLQLLIDSMAAKQTVIVTASGNCTITEDLSPRNCREQAIRTAEQSAIELGAQQIVQSVSTVVNLELVRDEIRSSTRARIVHKDLEVSLDPNVGDFGQYNVNITAAVQSIPPPREVSGASAATLNRASNDPGQASIDSESKPYIMTAEERESTAKLFGWAAALTAAYWAVYGLEYLDANDEVKSLKDDPTATEDQLNDAKNRRDDASGKAQIGFSLMLAFGLGYYSLSEGSFGVADYSDHSKKQANIVSLVPLKDGMKIGWAMRW